MTGAWVFATLPCVAVGKQEAEYLKIECRQPDSQFLVDGARLFESQRHTSSETLQAIPRLLIPLVTATPSPCPCVKTTGKLFWGLSVFPLLCSIKAQSTLRIGLGDLVFAWLTILQSQKQ